MGRNGVLVSINPAERMAFRHYAMNPFSTSFALASAIGVNTHANYAAYQNAPLVAWRSLSRLRGIQDQA